jgi:hypothetical protein
MRDRDVHSSFELTSEPEWQPRREYQLTSGAVPVDFKFEV